MSLCQILWNKHTTALKMCLTLTRHHHPLPLLGYLSSSAPFPNHTYLPPRETIQDLSFLAFHSTCHHPPISVNDKNFIAWPINPVRLLWIRYKVPEKTFPTLNRTAVTSKLFFFNAFHLFQPPALYPPASSQLIEKSLERTEGPNTLHIIDVSLTSTPF